ncbi:MAG TPA: type II toxin-antitoxin system HicB family antitoxin [Acidobacteriota bacterium]
MPIHQEVLTTARRFCRERKVWTFTPEEIVRALPHLNEHSVRTHIVSRCCVNAPVNHPHKWNYFRRVGRGLYEILPAYRKERPVVGAEPNNRGRNRERLRQNRIAESPVQYGRRRRATLRASIHAVVHRDEEAYVAECLEVAVVTQGRTIDELISNLQEAIALHLQGENLETLGLSEPMDLVVTYELPLPMDVSAA